MSRFTVAFFVAVMTPLTIWAVGRFVIDAPAQSAPWHADEARQAELDAIRDTGEIDAMREEATAGDPAALTALGEMLCQTGALAEAEILFAQGAAKHYPPAMIASLALSAPRSSTLADPVRAARLWRGLPALEATTAAALAEAFVSGPCMPDIDRDRAFWFLTAIASAVPDGMLSLAASYETGEGLPRDAVEAYALVLAVERYHDSWPPPPRSASADTIERLEAELSWWEEMLARRRATEWNAILIR